MKNENLIANGYSLTRDIAQMDMNTIYHFLSKDSAWALNIPHETVKKSMENSLCFAVLHKNHLVAFARVITDKATFAHLVDVFVLPEFRGKGLSKWLMQDIVSHPDLIFLRRFTLTTATAKDLYKKFGFDAVSKPETYMEKLNEDIYK